MTQDRQRPRRTARLQARRTADELLIEAIFGDILLARLARPAAASDPGVATIAAQVTLR